MIKPITVAATTNFAANYYAYEVKSRFADQSNPHGFYKGYRDELAARVYESSVIMGGGLLLVAARMFAIVSEEAVPVTITNGYKGYIVAHIETFRPSDEKNCQLIAKTAQTFDAIEFTREDVYSDESNTTNKIYELPIYSFEIANGAIVNLTRLIKPVADYEIVKQIVDNALSTATAANTTAAAAQSAAANALTKASNAEATAAEAEGVAAESNVIATNASNRVEELSKSIAEKQGTIITIAGTPQSTLEGDGLMFETDIINIRGGGA